MNLSDYTLQESNVQDIRFGTIDIYYRTNDPQDIIFCKISESSSAETHRKRVLLSNERFGVQYPYLLKMIHLESDDTFWIIKSYFNYPPNDLRSRSEELVNDPLELIKFIHDLLSATAYLESKRVVHGDVRSEFIYYDLKSKKYILCDRLCSLLEMNIAQYENIQGRHFLYMSPQMFNGLVNNEIEVKHNPFKSELFSVGMLVLDFFSDEDKLQRVYDFERMSFNEKAFQQLLETIKESVFNKPDLKLVGDFLSDVMLAVDEGKRYTSIQALKIYRATIWNHFYKNRKRAEIGDAAVNGLNPDEGGRERRELSDPVKNNEREMFDLASGNETPERNQSSQISENPPIEIKNDFEQPKEETAAVETEVALQTDNPVSSSTNLLIQEPAIEGFDSARVMQSPESHAQQDQQSEGIRAELLQTFEAKSVPRNEIENAQPIESLEGRTQSSESNANKQSFVPRDETSILLDTVENKNPFEIDHKQSFSKQSNAIGVFPMQHEEAYYSNEQSARKVANNITSGQLNDTVVQANKRRSSKEVIPKLRMTFANQQTSDKALDQKQSDSQPLSIKPDDFHDGWEKEDFDHNLKKEMLTLFEQKSANKKEETSEVQQDPAAVRKESDQDINAMSPLIPDRTISFGVKPSVLKDNAALREFKSSEIQISDIDHQQAKRSANRPKAYQNDMKNQAASNLSELVSKPSTENTTSFKKGNRKEDKSKDRSVSQKNSRINTNSIIANALRGLSPKVSRGQLETEEPRNVGGSGPKVIAIEERASVTQRLGSFHDIKNPLIIAPVALQNIAFPMVQPTYFQIQTVNGSIVNQTQIVAPQFKIPPKIEVSTALPQTSPAALQVLQHAPLQVSSLSNPLRINYAEPQTQTPANIHQSLPHFNQRNKANAVTFVNAKIDYKNVNVVSVNSGPPQIEANSSSNKGPLYASLNSNDFSPYSVSKIASIERKRSELDTKSSSPAKKVVWVNAMENASQEHEFNPSMLSLSQLSNQATEDRTDFKNSAVSQIRNLNAANFDGCELFPNASQKNNVLTVNGKKLYLCRVENGVNVYRYLNE